MWSEVRGGVLTVENFGSIFLNTFNKSELEYMYIVAVFSKKTPQKQNKQTKKAFCEMVTRYWANALLLFETFF